MKPAVLLAIVALIIAGGAIAQVNFQGVFRTGTRPVTGNCAKFTGPNSIADTGGAC